MSENNDSNNIKSTITLDNTPFIKNLRSTLFHVQKSTKRISGSFDNKVTSSVKQSTQEILKFHKVAKSDFKDVSRIVQGILISQAFYKLLNILKQTTAAVINMGQEFEQANISFALFLDDVPKAARLMQVLEDFAAKTPFSIKQSYDSARKLLAVGFKDKSLLTVLESLQDATVAAGGSTDVLSRITLALSKIKTLGRVTQRQLNQFALAGIPAQEILQEKLQLTQHQLENIGNTRIPADIGIKALVDGIHERYGGISELTSQTMLGLTSTVKDNLLLLGKDLTMSSYSITKGFLKKFANALQEARDIFKERGTGGLVEYLFPLQLIPHLRLFVANVKTLFAVLRASFIQLVPVLTEMLKNALLVFNTLIPVFNMAASFILTFTGVLMGSSRAVRILVGAISSLVIVAYATSLIVLFKSALKSLMIIKVLAQGFMLLTNAIRLLSIAMIKSPLMATFVLISTALLVMMFNSEKARSALNKLSSTIAGVFGASPEDQLLEDTSDSKASVDEFNNSLEITKESLARVGDEGEKTGNKLKKALMSFDEVFAMTDEDDSKSNGMLDEDVIAMMERLPEAGMIDLPKVKLGTLEALDFETFGLDFAKKILDRLKKNLTEVLVSAGIGGIIGGILGTLLLPGPGTVLGMKLGLAAGALVGFYWDEIVRYFKTSEGTRVATGITLGGIVGGIIGTWLLPGPGTALGVAIGATAGGAATLYWDELVENFKKPPNVALGLGTLVGGLIGTLLLPGAGTIIGAFIGGAGLMLVTEYFDDIVNAFEKYKGPVVDTVVAFGENIRKSINDWCDETNEKIANWKQHVKDNVVEAFETSLTSLTSWCEGTSHALAKWVDDTKKAIVQWSIDILTTIGQWSVDTLNAIGTWSVDAFESMTDWSNSVIETFLSFGEDTYNIVHDFIKNLIEIFENFITTTKEAFAGWKTFLLEQINLLTGGTLKKVTDWADTLQNKVKSVWDKVSGWKKDISDGNIKVAMPQLRTTNLGLAGVPNIGHARGGFFGKEHIARFAEGNKPEAVIPTANASATQAVVSAMLEGGLREAITQIVQANAQQSTGDTLIVGTLIGDKSGYKELERKLSNIRSGENKRRYT